MSKSSRKTIKIAAVGDIMPGDSYYCLGRGVKSRFGKDQNEEVFAHVSETLNQFDLVIGNLESVLSDKGMKRFSLRSQQYRGEPHFVHALKSANFTILNLANNHIMEHGEGPFDETRSTLINHHILPVGYPEIRQSKNPAGHIHELNGVKVAVLGYCLNKEKYTSAFVPKISDILDDVKYYNEIVDHGIVSLHWGMEYMNIPSPEQVDVGHQIIDAGASVILGHHPHVLQGIETYKERLIAYSLGNFVFNNWHRECDESVILSLELDNSKTVSHEILPVQINAQFQPEIVPPPEEKRIRHKMQEYSSEIRNNTVIKSGDQDVYLQIAKKRILCFRKQHHKFIFRNLVKLPLWVSLQILAKPFVKRARMIFRIIGIKK